MKKTRELTQTLLMIAYTLIIITMLLKIKVKNFVNKIQFSNFGN